MNNLVDLLCLTCFVNFLVTYYLFVDVLVFDTVP